MKKTMYLILIVLLTLYLIPLINYRVKEYRTDNIHEFNIGTEKEYAVMRDLMTSCGISGIEKAAEFASGG